MKNWFLVTLCLILLNQVQSTSLQYDDETLYNCKADSQYTQQQRRKILSLYPLDAYLFVVIGPISMLASLFIIVIFICLPATRKTPGDILLGLSLCDFVQTLHFILSGVFYLIYDTSPPPSSMFCQANGLLAVLVTTGDYLYNMAFVFTPLLLISNNLTTKASYASPMMHFSIILCMIGTMTGAYYDAQINLNLSGLCTIAPRIRQGRQTFHYGYLILMLTYFATAVIVMYQFKQLTQKNDEIKESVKKYMFIYRRFVYATTILWIFQLILSTITYFNCYNFQVAKLNVTLTLFNFISVITPIIQCYIRVQDPILRSQIKKHKLYLYFYPKQFKSNTLEISLPPMSERSETRLESEPNILVKIQLSVRTTQIYSMLAGVLMMNHKQGFSKLNVETEQISEFVEELGQFSKEDSDQQADLYMDNSTVQEVFPGNHEFSVFPTRIIFYAPNIFKYFLEKDKQMVNFGESLNLFKSKESVLSCSGPSGGKSGEFFFFSWDKKLIIKTMQWAEVLTLRKRMNSYGNYLSDHPDSMISKIYGIYTLRRLNRDCVESSVHILVMRNISIGIPRKYILRTFDMKGSEYDREVLNKKSSQDPSKVTLKDLDFFKTERKIFVKPNLSEVLLSAMTDDAKFFKQSKLIDYSLLVMKIDWKSYFEDTGILPKSIRCQITNPLYMIESSKEPGIFYHIAIIDYLQEWNVNKSAEQVTKKIIKFNSKLDTSAQNPEVYAERFKNKLVERILILTEEERSETTIELSNINH